MSKVYLVEFMDKESIILRDMTITVDSAKDALCTVEDNWADWAPVGTEQISITLKQDDVL